MDKKTVADTIIAIEIAALEKWNKGNPSGFLALLTPDITYFDPLTEKRLDGYEKMEELYESLRGKGSVDKYEMIDPVVQFVGDGVVLTYNLNSYAGDKLYKWNCTEVYKQEDENQWKIIHNHWSLVRPMPNNS